MTAAKRVIEVSRRKQGCQGVQHLHICNACALRERCHALDGLGKRVFPAAREVLAELRGRHG